MRAALFLLVPLVVALLNGPGTQNVESQIGQAQAPFVVCPSGCPFSSIQEAIDALPPAFDVVGKDLPVIQVRPGVYKENLIIQKSLHLKGTGKDQVILESAKEGYPAVLVLTSSGNGITVVLEGVTIKGARGHEGDGVQIFGRPAETGQILRSNLKVVNSAIRENERAAVSAFGEAVVHLETNLLKNNDIGVILADRSEGYILQNTFLENHHSGILVGNLARAVISENTIQKSGRYGIALTSLVPKGEEGFLLREIKVIENVIENSGETGIYLGGSAETSIKGNRVRRSGAYGIEFDYPATDVEITHTIDDNLIEENGAHGIKITGERVRVVFTRNRVFKNRRFGVVVEKLENIFFCFGNRVKENREGDYGVEVGREVQPSEELRYRCEAGP